MVESAGANPDEVGQHALAGRATVLLQRLGLRFDPNPESRLVEFDKFAGERKIGGVRTTASHKCAAVPRRARIQS